MSTGKDYTYIFNQIAKNNHTTVAEVRREIELAIQTAFRNPDPEIEELWTKIPYKGEKPTAEEVIAHVVQQSKKRGTSALPINFFEIK